MFVVKRIDWDKSNLHINMPSFFTIYLENKLIFVFDGEIYIIPYEDHEYKIDLLPKDKQERLKHSKLVYKRRIE
jgi:hypothetical protein